MIKRLLATFAFAAVVSTPVSGAITYHTEGALTTIPGLTGFATTGAMMDNMQVTACFTGNVCETLAWADGGGADAGRVIGTGWALRLNGDSFFQSWEFDFTNDPGQLVSLLLDGRSPALTIFDRTLGGAVGTPGSALGRDWTSALGADIDIDVFYRDPTRIGNAAAVNDIFQQVFVDFGDTGPSADFTFRQDTDNDSRFNPPTIPEPSTLLLLGLGMLAFAGVHRRRV